MTRDGYTLTGYRLIPNLQYSLPNQGKISLGASLLKYSGLDNFTKASPFLSAEYQITNYMDITLGNYYLEQTPITPLYSRENQVRNFSKSGAKIYTESPWSNYRLWINWRDFIFSNSEHQEKFTVGFIRKPLKNNPIYFPIEAIITHKGGEIDNVSAPVQSIYTFAGGLGFVLDEQLFLEAYGIHFTEPTQKKRLNASQGNGIYLLLDYTYKQFFANLSYFYADEFYCREGNELYWSTNENGYTHPHPENIKLDLKYKSASVKKLTFIFATNTMYELNNQEANFSFELCIKADLDFNVWSQ